MRDKVDHPRKGSKDLADAVCGSIYNAISRTKIENNQEISIHTYDSMIIDNYLEEKQDSVRMNVIRPPRMPQDLADAIEGMSLI